MDAMLPHFDVCSVVRGIAMDTVTHEVGRRYFITGMTPVGYLRRVPPWGLGSLRNKATERRFLISCAF